MVLEDKGAPALRLSGWAGLMKEYLLLISPSAQHNRSTNRRIDLKDTGTEVY
jgi:hypothetical protein